LLRVPGVFVEAAAVDGFDAGVDEGDGEFIAAEADDGAVLAVRGEGGGVVEGEVPAAQDPEGAKEGDAPVSWWDMAEGVQVDGVNEEFVCEEEGDDEEGEGGDER
jgi:hypothetical protein